MVICLKEDLAKQPVADFSKYSIEGDSRLFMYIEDGKLREKHTAESTMHFHSSAHRILQTMSRKPLHRSIRAILHASISEQ